MERFKVDSVCSRPLLPWWADDCIGGDCNDGGGGGGGGGDSLPSITDLGRCRHIGTNRRRLRESEGLGCVGAGQDSGSDVGKGRGDGGASVGG
ncbi:hypothetical protein E2C01_090091 [Portunus trituberculatus]|uniref:Uncharacterized protein n=1 Tax=Portunus trituberculatus TaxID=210409 RepID=A0A5B7JAJ9_PORTR|nr:hypothetical protein [Portunus trituberculatus]